MMKTKQIWAAAIAFCMVFMLIPMAAFAENLYEGSCDKNLKWTKILNGHMMPKKERFS